MNTGEVIYPEVDHFKNEYKMLWQYLIETRRIHILKGIPSKHLEITSGYIAELIENADDSLINYVPEKVFNHIKENKLFGYGKNL